VICIRSIVVGMLASLAMVLPCLTSGCSGYASRSDFEECKGRIISIATVPPVVNYSGYEHPLFTIKGWEFGGKDEHYDALMSDATQKNIEQVASDLIAESRYKKVNCTWQADKDVMCVPNMERLRQAAPDIIYEAGRQGKKLNVSMGPDCAAVGQCAGATHLLFIVADGYSTRKLFENKGREGFWDLVLRPEQKDPYTGLEKATCKLGLRVMLVEASSASVIFCSGHAEKDVPGSHMKGIKVILSSQLKPVLGK